jgi:hypothetical protein
MIKFKCRLLKSISSGSAPAGLVEESQIGWREAVKSYEATQCRSHEGQTPQRQADLAK